MTAEARIEDHELLQGRTSGLLNVPIFTTHVDWTLDFAETAMLDKQAKIFQQNGRLVHLIHHNAEVWTESQLARSSAAAGRAGRHEGALVLAEVQPHYLVEVMISCGRWYKVDMRRSDPDTGEKGAEIIAAPNLEVARHYLARGQWGLRVLRGAIEAPTLRNDGSLLVSPGYDESSQLYLDTGGVEFPEIPDEPPRDEAMGALARIKDVLKDFPFEPDKESDVGGPSAARSVALSAVLTGLVRRSIATAPAHAIDAPVMGSGKTKISEVASVIATGRKPTAISYGSSQEEFQKRVFSVLYKGDAVVIIDNVEQEVESDEFCTILTSEQWQSRVLGVSKMATVPTNVLWLLNGNRMTFKGDITDRVILCNIDARMEDPKARTFDRDPVAYALEHRAELAVAGLTVLRAHAAAGFPGAHGLTSSRFPEWDRMVRGALLWLGEPDPHETRHRLVSVDPMRETHRTLMRVLREGIGLRHPVTAQQLIDRTVEDPSQFEWPAMPPWPEDVADELGRAIYAAVSGRVGVNSRNLGRYLMKVEGRISSGLVIRAKVDTKSASTFWLEVA
jgi:putative DNA primase/helicase